MEKEDYISRQQGRIRQFRRDRFVLGAASFIGMSTAGYTFNIQRFDLSALGATFSLLGRAIGRQAKKYEEEAQEYLARAERDYSLWSEFENKNIY